MSAALIVVLGAVSEAVLLDGAEAALNVLATRFGAEEPRCEGYYAANRALREVGQIRDLRRAKGSR
jgi:hypothetical protein